MSQLERQEWRDLEVSDHEDGGLCFKSSLRRRNKHGEVVEEPCMVRIPPPKERLAARGKAIPFLAKIGIDLKALKEIDERRVRETLDHAEDLCILAASIREAVAPHSQFKDVTELLAYDEACLQDIKERCHYFSTLLEPRKPISTDAEFWAVLKEVARKRNTLPLADIAGHELPSFIMRMAVEALKSQTKTSSATSSETSTPDS